MENYRLLYYQSGTQAWKQAPVTGETFSIGRAPENNLALEDEQVSRQHARLRIDARGVWIIDQNSSNGVRVGGRRIPAGEWTRLPLNEDITIGATTLRVEAVSPATSPSQPVTPAAGPARVAQPRQTNRALPLVGLLIAAACVCLVGGGAALWIFLPNLLSSRQAASAIAPPTVIDSLSASAGGGPVQDEHGVSLEVPPDALETSQQAYLERASLSQGMQREIEKAYQVESLVYAVLLQDGQDGIGRVELALPAPSPDSRLAVLIDNRYLGILETPAQDGVFRISPSLSLAAGTQTYPEPSTGAEQAPNRYLVLTPKAGSSQAPQGSSKLASLSAQTDPYGIFCILETWGLSSCMRNPESSVYVFWGRDAPESFRYKHIEDTIKAVTEMMSQYYQAGFTAAVISPSNPLYVIVEAGASEPYYSWRTGNVYVPWDIIGGIGDSGNRCTLAHEFFHFIEDEEYRMGVAAMSGPKSWWLETSAENGAFLLDTSCIEKNLTEYGFVEASGNVLGVQAAPLQWESGEQARYIHALQLYLSICDGGANCALSEAAWIQAINGGTYPLEGGALTAYQNNAKDLGRFLLGAAPLESRVGAVIPPSALSGRGFGDFLALRTSPSGIWDFGMTMNQFSKASEQQVKVEAKIAEGGGCTRYG